VYPFLLVFLPLLLYVLEWGGGTCESGFVTAMTCYTARPFTFAILLVGSIVLAHFVTAPVTRLVSLRWGDSRPVRAVPDTLLRLLFRPTNLRLLFLVYMVGTFAAFAFLHLGIGGGESTSSFVGGYFLFAFPAGLASLIIVSAARLLGLTIPSTETYVIALVAVSIPVGVAWLFFVSFCFEKGTRRFLSAFRRRVN